MKKTNKLKLGSTTIYTLTDNETEKAVGGWPTGTGQCSGVSCTGGCQCNDTKNFSCPGHVTIGCP